MKLNKTFILLAFVLACALFYQTQAFASGINAVVASLSDYQVENGGFIVTRDQEPSLEATSQALFLTSLFGLQDKIDVEHAINFIQSLKNSDNGFSNTPGQQSDLESVKNAVFSLISFDKEINIQAIGSFIDSLYDRDTKLYANTFSGTGNIKSTAQAYQVLDLLNLLETPTVVEKSAAIKVTFSNLIKTDSTTQSKYFFSLTTDNYYALLVAHYVGIDLGEVNPWAQYFIDRQVASGPYAGGFFADEEGSDISPEDTLTALAALVLLQGTQEDLVDLINGETLVSYISILPRSLRAAYSGFSTLARVNALQQTTFRTIPFYEYTPLAPRPSPSYLIVQGSVVQPALAVRTFFGLAHPGLEVTVSITHERTGEKVTDTLVFNPDNQLYSSARLYEASDLGDVTFQYIMTWKVVELGDLVMVETDKKVIGFDLNIAARAENSDGDEVRVGGFVSKGTSFSFDVKLGNVKSPKPTLLSGDFDVVFVVLDSSNAVIYKQIFDARKNTVPIQFDYTLKNNDIPAGDLVFKVEVGDSKIGFFSRETVSYILPLTMVATNVAFSGFNSEGVPTYEIGQTIDVVMQPGSLSELQTVEFYSSKDNDNNSIRRKFVMQVSSADTAEPLFYLDGIPKVQTDGKLSYVFSIPITPAFSYIGTNAVSFIYVTANGRQVPLRNYDLKNKEFVEEGKHIYTVQADLHITNIKSEVHGGKLEYGNNAKISFQIKDEISKKLLFNENTLSSVQLVLKHQDGKKTFVSTRQTASQINDKQTGKPSSFQINWSVNPNAISGQASLELVVLGADNKEIPVLEENSKNPWKVEVEIRGDIKHTEKQYVDIIDDEDAVFLVEFGLSCNNQELRDALMEAEVIYGSESIITLPVTEGQEGKYTVSWTQDVAVARSGTYQVRFYRAIDRTRGKSDALFSVNLYYAGASAKFPIKLEVVALVGLGAAFFWLVFLKMEIEGTRNKNKKTKTK